MHGNRVHSNSQLLEVEYKVTVVGTTHRWLVLSPYGSEYKVILVVTVN